MIVLNQGPNADGCEGTPLKSLVSARNVELTSTRNRAELGVNLMPVSFLCKSLSKRVIVFLPLIYI